MPGQGSSLPAKPTKWGTILEFGPPHVDEFRSKGGKVSVGRGHLFSVQFSAVLLCRYRSGQGPKQVQLGDE